MSEAFQVLPFANHTVDQQLIIHQEDTVAVQPPAPPDAKQVEALDNVFVQQKEDPLVAGLLSLWSSTLLLHDLAKEHFHVPAGEELRRNVPSLPDPDEDE